MTVPLSPQQTDVANHPGSVYVRACPGAGKTRTLVARAVRLAGTLPPARGIALLSFTNSAADEFKERLLKVGAAGLLKPPHFVGTIDSFLARFVVMPRGNPWAPELPIQHVESWRRYTFSTVIGRTAGGKPDLRTLPLSVFPVTSVDLGTGEIVLELDLDRLGRERGRGLASQIEGRGDSVIGRAEATATKVLKAQLVRGWLSPAEVRLLAAEFLLAKGELAAAHNRNLFARFPQLVVDEAQDCDGVILALLQGLAETGTQLTLIADPDQCIYAWRGAKPKELVQLSKSWAKPPTLTGNYRSSPNICRAASAFKEVSSVDESRGHNSDCDFPVFVAPLKFSEPSSVGRLFLELLREHSICASDAIVLAPSWSLAMAIAGVQRPANAKQKLGGKLRAACFTARNRADIGSLKNVRELVEDYLVKRVAAGALPSDDPRVNDWVDAEIRRLTCEVLIANPETDDWHTETLETLQTFRLPPTVALGESSPRKCLPKPGKPLEVPASPVSGLAYSSVHQAKGREYPAVLYAAGRSVDYKLRELMEDWTARRSGSERRAVAYVGVTRAERLLLFATPQKLLDDTQGLLQRDGATVELREP